MNFVKDIIGPDERLILVARLHWIYVITGMIWCALFSGIGYVVDSQLWRWFGQNVPDYEQDIWILSFGAHHHLIFWLFAAAGVMFLVMHTLKVLATIVALTTRRLIYKTGWIFVAFEEVELDDIRAEHVHHGFLGRFLNYGQMKIDCRFVGDISLPAVKKPYRLIKAMHVARARLPQLGHTHDDTHTNPSPKENHQRNHNGEKSDDGFLRDVPHIRAGLDHLITHDPIFRAQSVNLSAFDWQYYGAGFAPLVRIVVGQQLSMKAAATIWRRFEEALPVVTPDAILAVDDETLRSVGLSRQKVQYVRNVAQAVRNGALDPKALERMSDDDVAASITAIKGLGAWSAQMYLMFALARPDVFPSGDLGIQDGMRWYLNLSDRPDTKHVAAEKYRFTPHGTAAALLLWHLKS